MRGKPQRPLLQHGHIDSLQAGCSQFGIMLDHAMVARAHHCQADAAELLEAAPKSQRSLGSLAPGGRARADWTSPSAVKAHFRSASVLWGNRVVFNAAGNEYWLVVKINYPYRVVYVRFIGMHVEYDAVDATII